MRKCLSRSSRNRDAAASERGRAVTASASAAAVFLLLAGACASHGTAAPAYRGGSAAGVACSTSNTGPAGMPVLTVARLPGQAVATLRLIAAGGPFPYAEDDTVYGNYSGALPHERRGYYREFTVVTPGSATRGARRVVTGAGGEDYYTADHYTTFEWIACGN